MSPTDMRHNLILALVEEGKYFAAINAALVKTGQVELSEAEVITYGVQLKLDAVPAAPAPEAKAPEAKAHKKHKTPLPAEGAAPQIDVDGIKFAIGPKFAAVQNDHGGMNVSLIADNFLAQASQFLRAALGDEWYIAYKQLKNPGFTKATAATRDVAYAFVLRTLLALKKPLNDAKDKAG